MMPDSTLYDLGILTSNVHMSWMRAVAGRLKSDYRYSNTIVYNNFPWPDATAEQKQTISQTAQGILQEKDMFAQPSDRENVFYASDLSENFVAMIDEISKNTTAKIEFKNLEIDKK